MTVFFSGIGGAGTLPLALILDGLGKPIAWSDRGRDQGQLPVKFSWLENKWPRVWPQDGSGLHELGGEIECVIPSGSVEDKVPDIQAAKELSLKIIKRSEMLAQLFNAAPLPIGIAGTSGKTTTTGMVGFLLREAGLEPTMMNGGMLRNYLTADTPFPCAFVGKGRAFVSEVDESDGSIALYNPHIAVVTNITLDHKPLAELRPLFSSYIQRASYAILNADDEETMALPVTVNSIYFGIDNPKAELNATQLTPRVDGIDCLVNGVPLKLQTPGRHNVQNALAAIGVGLRLGLSLDNCCTLLGRFAGISRRLEVVGQKNGITVIDDFGHNPDKIRATLCTLKALPGRLIVMFQPHGYGPLRLMQHELADAFSEQLDQLDYLFMPEPFYAGGTVDRSVGSREVAAIIKGKGVHVTVVPTRADTLLPILMAARPGDRIIVMGARDESLPDFAAEILRKLP